MDTYSINLLKWHQIVIILTWSDPTVQMLTRWSQYSGYTKTGLFPTTRQCWEKHRTGTWTYICFSKGWSLSASCRALLHCRHLSILYSRQEFCCDNEIRQDFLSPLANFFCIQTRGFQTNSALLAAGHVPVVHRMSVDKEHITAGDSAIGISTEQ